MNEIIRLKRGKKESNYIPLEGEPIYTMDTKELLIGDGINKVSELKSVSTLNNIAYDEDGRLYQVKFENEENDNSKKAILIPLTEISSLTKNEYNFYI